MRTLFTLALLGLCVTLFAQTDAMKERATAGANLFLLLDRKGSGTAYLTTTGATTAGNEISLPVDSKGFGTAHRLYEGFDHATATVADGQITSVTFPNTKSVGFLYAGDEITGLKRYPYVKWENNRPVFAATEWAENDGKVKGDDWVRTAVYLKYDDRGRYVEVSRYTEFAKGKSLEKLKPQKESQANLLLDYRYSPGKVTATNQSYRLKNRKWQPYGSGVTYTLDFSKDDAVTYRSANGKLEKTMQYDDGRLVSDVMTSRMMGYVRREATYEYSAGLVSKKVEKVYSAGNKLSEVITDNWDVLGSEPAPGETEGSVAREYAGGEVTNGEGTVIRQRRLGEERRLNPDGTWTAWMKRKGVGK